MERKRKVLVIDDDEDILKIISLGMRRGGWEVTCARTGAEAVELAPGLDLDVVLLDVMMPQLDGAATLAGLRDRGVRAPVIFMTALGSRAPVDADAALRVEGVISKPFDPLALPERVGRIVDAAVPGEQR